MIKRFGALVLSIALGFGLIVPLTGCSSESYTPTEKSPSISTPTIGKEGVLRVGVDASNLPFAWKLDSGIVGINVDIAAAIADELGLKLEIVDFGSDPQKLLEEGSIDIAMGVDKSNTSTDFWSSDVYIQSAVALFATSPGAGLPTDASTRIAAQTSSMSAWEVNKQFGEDALVPSSDLQIAFSDLSSGSVNYVASDAIIGTFAAHTESVEATIVGLLQKPSGYAIGVLDDNSELKQLISDTLVKLTSNGMIGLIETKWLGEPVDLAAIPLTETTNSSAPANVDEGTGSTDSNDDSSDTDAGTNGETENESAQTDTEEDASTSTT